MVNKTPNQLAKKSITSKIFILLLLLGCFAVVAYWWQQSNQTETTKKAFVRGHSLQIISRLSAPLKQVLVMPYQQVKKGMVLFAFNEGPYQLRYQKEKLTVQQLADTVKMLNQQLSEQQNYISSLKQEETLVKKSFKQQNEFYERMKTSQSESISKSKLLTKEVEVLTAQLKLQSMNTALVKEQLTLVQLQAKKQEVSTQLALARQDLRQAEVELSKTKIIAPHDGVIGYFNFRVGQNVLKNQTLAALFYSDDLWVEAYFSETQLNYIHVGQNAVIYVNSYPRHALAGVVKRVAPASLSQMESRSITEQLGTTIIDQKFPVIIDISEPNDLDKLLKPGMSAAVKVDLKSN